MRRLCHVALTDVCLTLVAVSLPAASFAKHTAQHRYLTEQKNRLDIPASHEALTFADFLALPTLPAEYSASDWDTVRHQTKRAVSLE